MRRNELRQRRRTLREFRRQLWTPLSKEGDVSLGHFHTEPENYSCFTDRQPVGLESGSQCRDLESSENLEWAGKHFPHFLFRRKRSGPSSSKNDRSAARPWLSTSTLKLYSSILAWYDIRGYYTLRHAEKICTGVLNTPNCDGVLADYFTWMTNYVKVQIKCQDTALYDRSHFIPFQGALHTHSQQKCTQQQQKRWPYTIYHSFQHETLVSNDDVDERWLEVFSPNVF